MVSAVCVSNNTKFPVYNLLHTSCNYYYYQLTLYFIETYLFIGQKCCHRVTLVPINTNRVHVNLIRPLNIPSLIMLFSFFMRAFLKLIRNKTFSEFNTHIYWMIIVKLKRNKLPIQLLCGIHYMFWSNVNIIETHTKQMYCKIKMFWSKSSNQQITYFPKFVKRELNA